MDETARLEQALFDGHAIDKACSLDNGQFLGQKAPFQELLGVAAPSADELSHYNEMQLSELANQPQQQLRNGWP